MYDSLIDLAWLVYFIDVVATEDYHDGFGVMFALGIVGWGITTFIPDAEWEEGVKGKVRSMANTVIGITIIYTVYYTVIPSKDTAWHITGIVMAAKVADNPEIQKLSGEGINILEKKLKMYSKQLDKQLGMEEGEN